MLVKKMKQYRITFPATAQELRLLKQLITPQSLPKGFSLKTLYSLIIVILTAIEKKVRIIEE